MKRFTMFFSGLVLMTSMTGCCLFGHGCGSGCGTYGAGYPYSNGFGGGGCPGGNCGAAAPGYPQAFNGGVPQAAFAPGTQTALIEPMPTF